MSHEGRIETLEFKIAHLERALQELSDALYRQQQRLDAHESGYQRLIESIESAAQPQPASKFEVPPHY